MKCGRAMSTALSLPAGAAGPLQVCSQPAGASSGERTRQGVAAASEKPSLPEAKLFELIRMIRDWIERSFTSEQEARLKEKGRLRARFQVELGREMADNLKAYIAASFALRLLRLRVTHMDLPGGRKKECVEVVLLPEARQLYQEKHPDACAKYLLQLAKSKDTPESGLVDADDDEQPGMSALSIGPQTGSTGSSLTMERSCGLVLKDASTSSQLVKHQGAAAEQLNGNSVKDRLGTPEKLKSVKLAEKRGSDAPTSPAKHIKLPSTSGSVWDVCEARLLTPGPAGLIEAKAALDDALAVHKRGGLEALRAEKQVVSWLKGLCTSEVRACDLQETKIGIAVNAWRKQGAEAYITELCSTIVMAWKRTWGEHMKSKRG